MHIRLLHFHKVQTDQRIQMDVMRFGFFAHHLIVHLAAGGHVDDYIALHLGATRQTPALGQRLGGAIGFFHGRDGRQIRGVRDHAVFGEFTFGHQHLAATANTATAANRINVHAKRAPGLEQGGAQGKTSASPRGCEND